MKMNPVQLLDSARDVLEAITRRDATMPFYRGSQVLGGAMGELTDEPTKVFDELLRRGDSLVETRLGPIPTYLVLDADHALHILQENAAGYTRPRFFTRLLRATSGINVFSAEGEVWRRQRKILSPPFRPGRLAALAGVMGEEARRLVERWQGVRGPVDVQEEMTQLSLNVVGKALFSVDMLADPRGRELTSGFDGSTRWLNHRRKHVLAAPRFVPTPVNRGLAEGKARVERVLRELVDERRSSGVERPDMLQMLLSARDKETDRQLTTEEIVAEMATFFFAGHETTANTLTWALYLLSQHPEAEARVREELGRVLGGRPPAFEDAAALREVRMVVEEALRLYPPAWAILRESVRPDQLGPHRVRAGATFYVSVYGVQRSARYWDEPARFDPQRFTEARSAGRHPGAFLPFGAGPRVCMGNHFAILEAQLLLATILQRYRLRMAPGARAEPETVFTLRVRGGLPMLIEDV